MNFRDEINNTIQNASNYEAEAAKRKQEAVQQEVDGVCDWVRSRIKAIASCHTNPNIPFKANMYFVCFLGDAYIEKGRERFGYSQHATQICQLTFSEDILIREKLIRDQLKADGIIVGKWQLYEAQIAYGDDVTPIPRYLCSYAKAFGVYEENEIRNATRINIDPYKQITVTIKYGLLANTWNYTYSQGVTSFKKDPRLDMCLIMPISFS